MAGFTQKEYITLCKEVHGDRYDLSELVFTGVRNKVDIICRKHGKFSINAKSFRKGSNCPKCNRELQVKRQTLTLQDQIRKSVKIHGDSYDYSLIENYKDGNHKVTFKCNNCSNVFKQSFSSHITVKTPCNKCAAKKIGSKNKTPIEDVEKSLKEKHGDKYTYDFSNYKGVSAPIKYTCLKHNITYEKAPRFLLQYENNCEECLRESYLNKRSNLSKEDVLKRFKEAHGDFYDYSKFEFSKSSDKSCIICPLHGEFYTTPFLHYRGSKCPNCAHSDTYFSKENFELRAREVHGDKFDYSKVQVNKSHDYVTIKCKDCTYENTLKAYSHIAGKDCPKCSNIVSNSEDEICELLDSWGITYKRSDRKSISPKELDVYIPSKNLAIEFNGLYWHSSGNTEKDAETKKRHLTKTKLCEDVGIQLFHIFEDEWNDPIKKSIWIDTLKSKLGLGERLFARKCTLRVLPYKQAKVFLENNHLQGASVSSFNLGLYFKDELVALATFSKARYTKSKDDLDNWELVRLCSKKDLTVVGGGSKLIKNFFKLKGKVRLISYANRRWSTGNVYKTLGFTLINVSDPCYFYYQQNATVKVLNHRSKYQKHKLKGLLKDFNPALSEAENMYNNKFRRIWDSGNLVFEYVP